MTTIATGESETFPLPAGYRLDVTASALTVGTVAIERSSEDPEQSVTSRLRSRTFGPFSVGANITVSVESGSVDYSVVENPVSVVSRVKGNQLNGARRRFHGKKFRMQTIGQFSSTSNQNMTRRVVRLVPDGLNVHTVIAAIPNSYSGSDDAIPVLWRANIRTSNSVGDAVYSSEVDWLDFTKNGFVDMSSPHQSDEESGEVYGWVFSDPLPLKLKKWVSYTTWGRANTTRATAEHTFTAGPTGTLSTIGMTAFSQIGVNGVTDPTALDTPVYDTRMSPMALICLTDMEVYDRVLFGGSQAFGLRDTTDFGFHSRMFKNSLLDGGAVVSTTCNADQGADTQTQLKLFRGWMAIDPNCDEVQFPLTQGDDEDDDDYVAGLAAGTVAGWEPYETRMKGQVMEVVTECQNRGIATRITINRYKTDVDGDEYEMHQRLVAWARAEEAKGTFLTDDMPSMFNDEDAAVGTVRDPDHTSDDNVHPNALGHAYWAETLLAKIRLGR
jgi:hypothetical protein